MTHRSATHGQTRVTRIGLLDGIDGEESDRVDGLIDQGSLGRDVDCLDRGGVDWAEDLVAGGWEAAAGGSGEA